MMSRWVVSGLLGVWAWLAGAGAIVAAEAEDLASDTRALVVVDGRLQPLIQADLAEYVRAATDRRGFRINILTVKGIDDWKPPEVRAAVVQWLTNYPRLEGILFVGNIKLPSFFMPRPDLPETRLWPRYYEDLEMLAERRIEPGTVLQPAKGPNPTWPFVAAKKPFTVPPHDFDDLSNASPKGPRLWTAYLPVGFSDDQRNDYENFARQLAPFFQKALAFYRQPERYRRALYIVSNDLGVLDRAASVWNSVGPGEIEYYAINTQGPGAFKNNSAGYVRTDLREHASLRDFLAYARDLPWMDEGWQAPDVFLSHMAASRRRVVCWNVHSNPELSLLTWQQARDMEGGGLVAMMLGCGVAGYRQPGSESYVDTPTTVDRNVLVNVAYGKSAFVAAVGSPFARVRDENGLAFYGALYKAGGYLGQAHLQRLRDGVAMSPQELRQQQEILVGDPFVDAR